MLEQAGREMGLITGVEVDGRGSTGPEEMRIDRDAKGLASGYRNDSPEGTITERLAAPSSPKSIAFSAKRKAVVFDISIDGRGEQRTVYSPLIGPPRFGLLAWEYDPPVLVLAPERGPEFETGECSNTNGVKCEERDHQSIAIGKRANQRGTMAGGLCLFHEGEARRHDAVGINDPVVFWSWPLVEIEVLFDLPQPGKVVSRSQDLGCAA